MASDKRGVMETFRLDLGNGEVSCVRVKEPDALGSALAAVGLTGSRPAVVVVGGAGGLGAGELERLTPVFTVGLVPAIERVGAIAIDGGTDSGVMRLLGAARARHSAAFSLVGVAAGGTVLVPGSAEHRGGAEDLEPHHTHFVLVPGDEWGDEASWIAQTATCIAASAPSLTVVVNGGDVAYADALRSLDAGRPVLVLAGSGRAADEIAAAVRGAPADARAQQIASSGRVTCVAADEPTLLAEAVTAALAFPPTT